MLGAWLNAAGILLGALIGRLGFTAWPVRTEIFFRSALSAFTAFFGLRLVWMSLEGGVGAELRQLTIAVAATVLGGWIGKLFRLQSGSNRLGRWAGQLLAAAQKNPPGGAQEGFLATTVLFCAAPLGIVGAVADGLADYFPLLAIKAVMDGLAAAGFVRWFRLPFALAAVPVFLFLQIWSVGVREFFGPTLATHHLTGAVLATAGLLACLIPLVISGIRRVELAAYLPALVVAPLLAACWR